MQKVYASNFAICDGLDPLNHGLMHKMRIKQEGGDKKMRMAHKNSDAQ
jgi:hypothetical protein